MSPALRTAVSGTPGGRQSTRERAIGANANMEKAIRVISVERGHDPRAFALFPFGGAGGMHAVEMAGHLGMPTVIVPGNAGVLSAFGLLLAEPIKDYPRSLMKPDSRITVAGLEKEFRRLEATSLREMSRDGFAEKDVVLERSLDCRYLGQSYGIDVPFRRARTAGRAAERIRPLSFDSAGRLLLYQGRRPVGRPGSP